MLVHAVAGLSHKAMGTPQSNGSSSSDEDEDFGRAGAFKAAKGSHQQPLLKDQLLQSGKKRKKR